MAKKVDYPPVKEAIKSRGDRAPEGTGTYTHQPPYLASVKPGARAPSLPKDLVMRARARNAKRALKPVDRRTLALVDRALKKLPPRD